MSKFDKKDSVSPEFKSIQKDSLGLIATQSNSSASASSTGVKNNHICTMQLSKCVPTNNEQGPVDCSSISHQNSNRLSKQAASGDTGDNSTCEQVKLNSSTELPINPSSKSGAVTSSSGPTSGSVMISVKNTATSMSGSNPTTQFSDETKPPTNSVTENKSNLIINYLPPNMTQEEVRALFSSIGEVESCKLVREKTSGESLGYAFVKFYNTSDAGKAIKTLNGLRLQNKTVKVSLARPSSEAIKGANLYICGLPRKMTQTDLEKLFSTCGHIITARILYDTKTGLSRGVAFIRYDQRAEAEVAIRKLNGYLPPGAVERITVKFANSPSTNRSENVNVCFMKSADGDTGSKSITNSSYSAPLNQLGKQNATLSTDSTLDTSTRVQKNGAYHGISANIRHNNTPPTTRITRASTTNGQTSPSGFVFPSAHPNVNSTRMATGNSNCSYGNNVDGSHNQGAIINQGTTCYPSQLITNNLPLQLNGGGTSASTNNNRTEVGSVGSLQRLADVARIKCQAAAVAAAAAGVGFQSPGTMLGGPITSSFPTHLPTFGVDIMRGLGPSAHALLAPAFAASSGALTATGWCIFVYNLAPDTEESILWQLFGPFGAVQTVKVIRDPVTGKCKGFGFVTMSNYEEALLAIHSLNGFNLGNRVLQVSFKTKPNSRQMKFIPNSTTENVPYVNHLSGSGTPVPSGYTPNT